MTEKRAASRSAARYLEIDAELAGQRLDNFLLTRLKGVPRSLVYRLVRSGQVRVNSGRVRPGYRVQAGDRVRVPPVRQSQSRAGSGEHGDFRWLEDRIVYEDDAVVLLDKPAGFAVHGGSGIPVGCIEALRILRPADRALELVHRLDRETSGCLLIARRRSTLRSLHELLRGHEMRKYYLALAAGSWPKKMRRVDHALLKQRRGGQASVKVSDEGKQSVTHFEPIERFGQFATLLGVTLETGRTHQIRVHAAAAGHPLAGDPQYGSARFNAELANRGLQRMFLHAASLSFEWPDEQRPFGVCIPLPDDLQRLLRKLRSMPSS